MSQFSNVWFRKPILGWLLYDVASSGYIQIVPAVVFAIYYRQVVCGGTPNCDAEWAMLTSLSLIVAGIVSPFLGALSDLSQLRHRLFVGATLLSCVATASLYWVQPGDLVLSRSAFLLARTGYILAMSLYDAYLPSLAPKSRLGQLSGLGWGLGYLGGLTCLLITYQWIQGGLAEANLPYWYDTAKIVQ